MVEIPLSLAASTGTSAKDFWMVSNQVDMLNRVNRRRKKREMQAAAGNERRPERGECDSYQQRLSCHSPLTCRRPRKQVANQGPGGGAPESKHANRINRANKVNEANISALEADHDVIARLDFYGVDSRRGKICVFAIHWRRSSTNSFFSGDKKRSYCSGCIV